MSLEGAGCEAMLRTAGKVSAQARRLYSDLLSLNISVHHRTRHPNHNRKQTYMLPTATHATPCPFSFKDLFRSFASGTQDR